MIMAQAARLRGCWVFINKRAPLESVGQEVQHMDEVVLEQEFAYLCSPHKVRERPTSCMPYLNPQHLLITNAEHAQLIPQPR
jgi:hypothetical protein